MLLSSSTVVTFAQSPQYLGPIVLLFFCQQGIVGHDGLVVARPPGRRRQLLEASHSS